MSDILSKPQFKLKIYFENNAKEDRNFFKTTESYEVFNRDTAVSILSSRASEPGVIVKKALFQGKSLPIPKK